MVALKLFLLSLVLIGLATAGIALKMFFQKNAKLPTTSCHAGTEALNQRGVDSCAVNNCETD